jgi:hypothetical protein
MIEYGKQKYKYHGTKQDYKKGTKLAQKNKSNLPRNKNIGIVKKRTRLERRNKLKLNIKQKYRNHGTKKGTRLAQRNKLNLNADQKYTL